MSSVRIHPETIFSANKTSSGLGSGPTISERIMSSLITRASSASALPRAAVFIRAHCPIRASSDASRMTSGPDSRNRRRSSPRAFLSPSAALSLSFSSSASLSFASFDSSRSFTFPPPFSLVFVKTGREQLCPAKYLCRLLQLAQELCAPLEAVPLLSPRGLLLFPLETFEFVQLGDELAEGPAAPVFLSHALPFAHRAVVVQPAAAFFPTHQNLEPPLQKRGGRRDVAQHEVILTSSARQHASRPERSAPSPSRAAPAGPAPERAAVAAARRDGGSTGGPARTPQRQRLQGSRHHPFWPFCPPRPRPRFRNAHQ